MESLVPRHKFADHPKAAAYLRWVDERRAAFSEEEFLKVEMEKWQKKEADYQKALADDKAKGVDKKRRPPPKPDGSIRTWSVPGRSPSDAAACNLNAVPLQAGAWLALACNLTGRCVREPAGAFLPGGLLVGLACSWARAAVL